MKVSDLKKYCKKALTEGATHAIVIHPDSVVTAPWVRFKCLYGCAFRHGYGCPPETPTAEQTRAVLDSYGRAILFHLEIAAAEDIAEKDTILNCLNSLHAFNDMLVAMEGDIFKDGYYKAFVLLAGPCHHCNECGQAEGIPCRFPAKVRPSMEACGIDVFQTVRNNGLEIKTVRGVADAKNFFFLMLVD